MAPHNSKEMSLVLSSDAKPRLKWTQELHRRFVDAVNQLGGVEKATPKSLMRVMSISGLTLYHLKSHLQKYRLGRSQQSQTYHQIKHEENEENKTSQSKDNIPIGALEKTNESLQVAQALQMQMDVQRKLQEQIDVQRHLQLRIEAQGKYLQSVLIKAQEALFDYGCSSSEVEQVKASLGQLVSMVNFGYPKTGHSIESSLTSSDSSRRNGEIQTKNSEIDSNYKRKETPVMLSLMEMHPVKRYNEIESSNRKRSKSKDLSNSLDLNCEFGSSRVHLNCKGLGLGL